MADNLYSADSATNKIYKHSGFSTTILDSIAPPSTLIYGLTWENFNARIGYTPTGWANISYVNGVDPVNILSYLSVLKDNISSIDSISV